MLNFQDMIAMLTKFWSAQGCIVHQGYDLEVGAGTFNPATFLRSLGPEPYSAVYVEPSRRPQDGRYGENPNRVQHYHQMQVIFKPSPHNIQELYLESLRCVGLNLDEHDIRFVHDDWENPTIGAWGLGWEVWLNGMEITQFTYFQAVGGVTVKPVSGEITYGLERLAMYLQGVDSIFDIKYSDGLTYGDIFKRSELEWSHYNFHEAAAQMWFRHFDDFEKESRALIARDLPIPAYDFVMKASHAFNILDARGVISVTERTGYIGRIRALAKELALCFIKSREKQKFPLLRSEGISEAPKAVDTIHTPGSPNEKADFLLEIGSEELPATFVPIGMKSLERHFEKLLKENDIAFEEIKTFGTPRRLSILVKGLASGTLAQTIEKKGPPISSAFDEKGLLTQTGEGFFRSLNLSSMTLEEVKKGKGPLEIRMIKETPYLFAHIKKESLSTRKLLKTHLPSLILNLDFPKKMRWGSLDIEYARPLRSFVALYGDEVIPFTLAGITSGNMSHGHRQLCNKSCVISHANQYVETLRKHHVIVDVEERKKMIEEGLDAILKPLDAHTVLFERVMAEVLYLVEKPFVVRAQFDPQFLKAPKEILISEMVQHQRYFPLEKGESLLPYFVLVSNNTPNENICLGNQRALTPRLADGLFLYEEDLKTPLEKFVEKLKSVTFQKELGSVSAKVDRIGAIVTILHPYFPQTSLEKAKRAASLCKADLVTQLVGEFPELQGVVGHFYALHSGEEPEVAKAIDEHWMPRGEKAPLPETPTGIILSLAEKIDNFLGCFSLGLLPTSSSDPYGLRRQALGLIKILISHHTFLPLKKVLEMSLEAFLKNPELNAKVAEKIQTERETILNQILDFLKNRMKTVFLDYGFGKDEIEAVLTEPMSDIYDRFRLLSALKKLRTTYHEQFLAALQVDTRTKKILQGQKKTTSAIDPKLFKDESEKRLFESLSPLFDKSGVQTRDYEKAFLKLSDLQPILEALFNAVKIMDENPEVRENRVALLQKVQEHCHELLDFSKIQEHE